MKVKKNDTVVVLTGKYKSVKGTVIEANPKDSKIKVDGVAIQKRSQKARNAKETSSIIEQCGAIDASNVLVVCPSCGKGTRVGYKTENDKKFRVCKKCGASLDVQPAKVTNDKKVAKKTAEKSEKTTSTTAKKSTTTAKKTTAAKKTTTATKKKTDAE